MFTSHGRPSEADGRQGGRPGSLAELRHHLSEPSRLTDGHRQRLLELAQRVEHVRALGGEYRRVSLSDYAAAAAKQHLAVT